MTYRLADADERAALDPVFGEGETTAIMREQWHEVLGYYSTVVAVMHVDDAAHVLEALAAHAALGDPFALGLPPVALRKGN